MMPITWKNSTRFSPTAILEKLKTSRTVKENGGISFSGLLIAEYILTINSMLNFPQIAKDYGSIDLIWSALFDPNNQLTADSFKNSINNALKKVLNTKETEYHIITSISLNDKHIPRNISILDAKISKLSKKHFIKYSNRFSTIPLDNTKHKEFMTQYSDIIIKVKAKSNKYAINMALRAIDFQRSIWCLLCNPQMQISYGESKFKPINVIKLGKYHTVHTPDGKLSADNYWFNPNHISTIPFKFKDYGSVNKNTTWLIKKISQIIYREYIISSMVQYVRALDEIDFNTAFIRLWSAIETLTTTNGTDYDKTVKRCAFLFTDYDFHKQTLEHLREHRNVSVHTGEESEEIRILCYQLQLYFVQLILFHARYAKYFSSLAEANSFLDSPRGSSELKRKIKLTREALRFTSAHS